MIKYHSKSVNNMDTGLDPEKECPICFEEYSRFCADCPSIINKFTPFYVIIHCVQIALNVYLHKKILGAHYVGQQI